MTTFLRHRLWPAIALLLALTVVTGFLYPLAVTAVAQVVFPSQAAGSFIQTADGRTIGSSLIGQAFSQPQYFASRPSAAGVTDTNPGGYDANASAGSNLGPTNQKLIDRITAQVDAMRAANGEKPIPVDLVTTSASGLDPDISPAGAEYQVARVAKARNMSEADLRAVVVRHTEQPFLGFLGQPRVNVLLLNLDLDGLLAH
jgi:potassium-transporting ATPase KdpC subunit